MNERAVPPTFSIGGKAFRLLNQLGDPEIDDVLRNSTRRKVGQHESITVSAPPEVIERMQHELADAAADRQRYDSCTRTQYRTAASRAESALGPAD